MDSQHLVVFAKATNTRVVLLHYWRQEAAFTCCDIDYRERDKDPVFKFSEGLPDFEEDYDFYRTLVIMNSIVVDVLDSNQGKGPPNMKSYESTHYSMWVPPVYRPGKEFVNVHETVNVNSVPRKKKITKKVASQANNDVASPLVDESIQQLNEEVERATTDSAPMNLDTIVEDCVLVNSSHVTDENVANVPNESLYEINSIFGNNVEGRSRDQHDLPGIAMAGIAPGNVGNDADATTVNIGDDAKVPYVDQNDDVVADGSKPEDMNQDSNCRAIQGSTTWHLLKWLNETTTTRCS